MYKLFCLAVKRRPGSSFRLRRPTRLSYLNLFKQLPYPTLRADTLSRVPAPGVAAVFLSVAKAFVGRGGAGRRRTGGEAKATGCDQRPGASVRSLPDSSRAPGVSILSPRSKAARAITKAEMGVVTSKNAAMRIAL